MLAASKGCRSRSVFLRKSSILLVLVIVIGALRGVCFNVPLCCVGSGGRKTVVGAGHVRGALRVRVTRTSTRRITIGVGCYLTTGLRVCLSLVNRASCS